MPSCLTRGACAALLSLCVVPCSQAVDPEPFSRRNPVVEAVQKTEASIVCIKVPRPGGGKDMIGSGVIVDERGIIVTNRHVVGTNTKATVCLHDGTALTGDVMAADPRCDLAVLRVTTDKNLKALVLAPVKDLMKGETVIAIGHPFGYTDTVSTGIISALNREITMPTQDVITGLIQTTTPINPGNSGGPLLNINGEVIGIVVALRDGANNIAFAINAADVKAFLGRHLSAQKVSGVEHGLRVSEKVIAEVGDRQRVIVAGAPTDLGLQSGDELRAVGSTRVANSFDIERALWGYKPGEQVTLKVVRQGHAISVPLTLTAGQGAGQVVNVGPMPATAGPIATSGAALSEPR